MVLNMSFKLIFGKAEYKKKKILHYKDNIAFYFGLYFIKFKAEHVLLSCRRFVSPGKEECLKHIWRKSKIYI